MKVSGCLGRICVFSCFLQVVGWLSAQPVIYQATGTRAEIQPVIDQFEHDIIYGPGGDAAHPPPIPGSFRVATFDDVGAGSTTIKQGQQPLNSGGIDFTGGPGFPVMVSANVSNPQDPSRLFGDLNSQYPANLEAFSSPSVLALPPISPSAFPGFFIAAEYKQGPQGFLVGTPFNAYGAVFTGVSLSASAAFQQGRSSVSVLPAAGPGTFSFTGVIATSDVYSSVETYINSLPGNAQGSLVTVDNFIIGMAYPLPEPAAAQLWLTAGALAGVAWLLRSTSRPRTLLVLHRR